MKHLSLLDGWEAVHAAGPVATGGKGWQLARLARYGLPVPDMLVIPAGMERLWLAGCELPSPEGDPSEPAFASVLERFHRQLLARPLPASLSPALEKLLMAKDWLDRPLAVRSSATEEDSATASFAGIHLSRLNLIGLQAILEGIREVWTSRWRPQAVAYRRQVGVDPAAVAMAVVVMPLLPAEASGIAFTCDPLNGRDDRLVVHAHWGLGEALVGGEATGDEILLEENYLDNSLRLQRYTTGDKRVMRQPHSNGTRLVETPPERVGARVLDDIQALALGALLRDAAISLDFSRPFFDLEWVWDGKRFWLVQARPVTARGRNTYPALRSQPEIWTRGNTCEVTPYPLSVYDWFGNRRMVNMMLERPLVMARYRLLPGAQRAGLFNGRLYLNLSLLQWEFYDAFGFKPKAFNAMVGGHQPEIAVPHPSPRQRLVRLARMIRLTLRAKRLRRDAETIFADVHRLAKQWREAPLPVEEPALLARLLELVRTTRTQPSLFFLQSASGGSLTAIAEMLEARLPNESHALTAALLAGGEPSVTARQAYQLSDLAKIARDQPAVKAWLADPRRDNDWWNSLPAENPFRAAFANFLERYGHRAVYETYFRHPRWRESPGYLFDTMQGLMDQDMDALRQRQRQVAKKAGKRAKHILPWWLRPVLKSLIKSAHEETNHREAARSALISLIEPQRRMLLQLGRHWQEQGIIKDPQAIFELSLPELQLHAEGTLTATGLAARVSDRQQQLADWQSQSAKEVVLKHTDTRRESHHEQASPSSDNTIFLGMAVGTGIASGRVRILRSPTEGIRLQPGEVLAAPSTDPSWTPLFLKAGALIMETGGCLSHGAIVAREFGIPAVVNLPGILARLEEGERVEVNGRLGQIRRL